MIEWKVLDSAIQLDQIIEESHQKPQVIFKHSTSCPISSMAKNRIERDWAFSTNPYYLDLIANRSISNEIASSFAIHHESPQIIVIKDGMGVYDESHLDINAEDLSEYIS